MPLGNLTSLKAGDRVFALCTSDDWVELRKAKKTPILKLSETKVGARRRERQVYRNREDQFQERVVWKPYTITLKVMRFDGGRLLASIPERLLAVATHIRLGVGAFCELSHAQVGLIKAELESNDPRSIDERFEDLELDMDDYDDLDDN